MLISVVPAALALVVTQTQLFAGILGFAKVAVLAPVVDVVVLLAVNKFVGVPDDLSALYEI